MSNDTYNLEELIKLVECYLDVENVNLLNKIQKIIEDDSQLKLNLINKLTENEEYIIVFKPVDQVKIIKIFIEDSEYLLNDTLIVCLIVYISTSTLNVLLNSIDNYSITIILKQIKEMKEVVGYRMCDDKLFSDYETTTTFFSRLIEKLTWDILYFRCKRCIHR